MRAWLLEGLTERPAQHPGPHATAGPAHRLMPHVEGDPDDTEERPVGWIRGTKKLLTTAALIRCVVGRCRSCPGSDREASSCCPLLACVDHLQQT